MSFGDRRTCHVEEICLHIKLSDGMIRWLKDMRYIPQLNKNLILIGVLEAHGLRGTF